MKEIGFISQLRNVINDRKNRYTLIIGIISLTLSVASFWIVSNNENYYKKTIAKVIGISEETSKMDNMNGKTEILKNQQIKATIMNGTHKGKEINLVNKSSFSGVNDLYLKINDEIFLTVEEDANNEIISSKILDLKRDKYILAIASCFILMILLVARNKGVRSLASVIINITIFVTTQAFPAGNAYDNIKTWS